MTIEEFLDENTYNLTPAEYNAALEDLEKMDKKSWIKTYAPLMEAKTAGWLDVEDVKKAKDLPSRLREAFGSSDAKNVFDRPSNYINEVYYKEFEDVPRDQFDAALGKMREYAQEGIDARREEGARKKRENEVKKWPLWRDILSSDYEKQRYIDNPSAAIFGEEATPVFGKDWLGKGEAISDLAYGVAGAAGDVLGGKKAFIGPGVRLLRDVQHKGYVPGFDESKYQKEWTDIAKNMAAEATLTGGTEYLKNFRKGQRMLGGASGDISKVLNLEDEARNIDKAFGDIAYYLQDETLSTSDKIRSLRNAYKTMPESELKSKVGEILNKRDIGLADLDEIRRLGATYDLYGRYAATPAGRKIFMRDYGGNENIEHVFNGESRPVTQFTPFTRRILEAPELTKFQNVVEKPAINALDKFMTGPVGSAALKLQGTAFEQRAPKKSKRVETAEERAQIEEIKNQEARFWEAGFKPNKNENDPLWRAYEEWYEENKRGEE